MTIRQALLYAAGAIGLWSMISPCVRVMDGVPPFLLSGLAFAAASVMVAVRWHRSGTGILTHIRALGWRECVMAVGGLYLYYLCYILALRFAPSIGSLLLLDTSPMWIVLLAVPMLGERPRPRDWAAMAVGAAGIVFLLAETEGERVEGLAMGYLLAILAALLWALYTILSHKWAERLSPRAVEAYFIPACVLSMLTHVLAEPFHMPDLKDAGALLFLGLGPFGLAYVWWDRAARVLPAARIAPILFLSPALGAVWLAMAGFDGWTFGKMIALACAAVAAVLPNLSRTGDSRVHH